MNTDKSGLEAEMAKLIRFDEGAREALRRGVDQMANAITVTLGPRGRNVILRPSFGDPIVTSDGLAIGRQIELSDPHENLGVQLLKEVATKTQEVAGDGTTTATLLAQAIVSSGLAEVEAGRDPGQLKRGIDLAVSAVVDQLHLSATRVQSTEDLAAVARTAGMEDADARLVASALSRVGAHGVVEIESGEGPETELQWVLGTQIERGYLSPYFINRPETMEVVLARPFLLFHERKISELTELIPILEQVAEQRASLVVMAEDVDGEALATLVMNRLRGSLEITALKAPGFGERRKEWFQDMATLTGGTVFDGGSGSSLASARLSDLGRAEQVLMTKETTTILGGSGTEAKIDAQVAKIEAKIEATESEYERERLQGRRGRLRGEIALLHIGGEHELEIEARRGRFLDAVAATRSAMSEGLVPGGGVALLCAARCLDLLEGKNDGEQAGIRIVQNALAEPVRKIAENGGFRPDETVATLLERGGDCGLNVESGEFESVNAAGIVDPTRVVRTALQNAASIGSLILTSETLVVEGPDDRAAS